MDLCSVPQDPELEHALRRGLEGAAAVGSGEEEAAHGPHVHALVDGAGVGLHLFLGGVVVVVGGGGGVITYGLLTIL